MLPNFDELKQAFDEATYLMTAHASNRAVERDIASSGIAEAVLAGEVIEDYPDDKYGLSCLLLGKTVIGRILHVQVSYLPKVKVITLYEPSADEWETDWKTRKS